MWAYVAFNFWKPRDPDARFNDKTDYPIAFEREYIPLATFYAIHGRDDVGPVKLSWLGWADMMENVVRIDLVHRDQVAAVLAKPPV